ncbi:glycosyltransferase [Thiohalorhabdus sp. Cl-TMA]|uniref:Glycosyltransferase n=1 Tax=Thiohalorhabdus methylotrophus TaxID=3242694 RepID=A0ABV4TUH1_9GAMM
MGRDLNIARAHRRDYAGCPEDSGTGELRGARLPEEQGARPSASKGLLVIASDFPPLTGTNTQRVQSFVRHLPDFGWNCRVVTQAVEDMGWIDSGELEHIPESVIVDRVPSPDPFAVRRRRLGMRPLDIHAAEAHRPDPGNGPHEGKSARGLIPLGRRVISGLLFMALDYGWYIPDSTRPWADAAVHRARGVIAEEAPDALLTSCPSYSSHVAGLKVKRRTGVPWVVDFRDLWVNRPGRELRTRFHALRDRRLEALVLQEADGVVVASPAWEEELVRRYGDWVRKKMVWVSNGYDPAKDPFSRVPNKGRERRGAGAGIRFVYTGAMDSSVSPAPFLEALGLFKQRSPEAVARFEVRLIGHGESEKDRLAAIVREYGLQEQVAISGPQSHERCLEEQAEADVLLLFSAPCHQHTITGKSFEYMRSGKPVLAMLPETGIQAQLLRSANMAWIFDYRDTDGVQGILGWLARGSGSPRVNPNWEYIRQFDRRALSAKLARLLDTVTGADG